MNLHTDYIYPATSNLYTETLQLVSPNRKKKELTKQSIVETESRQNKLFSSSNIQEGGKQLRKEVFAQND